AQLLWRGREADRTDQWRRGVCGRGGVVREIDQYRPAGRFEQLQGSPQDTCLKGRVTWRPQWSSQFEGDPEGARWGDRGRMFPDQADLGGGKTVPFEIMRKPANGARTGGSDRDEAHGIHLVLRQQTCELMGRVLHMVRISGAHKGVVKRRDAANDAMLRQLLEPVEGKDDIPVLLKAGAIKV